MESVAFPFLVPAHRLSCVFKDDGDFQAQGLEYRETKTLSAGAEWTPAAPAETLDIFVCGEIPEGEIGASSFKIADVASSLFLLS